MTDTVFYAWQSDLPTNINRGFIRDCIDRAIESLSGELGVEDAIRADQDTQDVAGDVNIAEVIFKKIDNCRVFIADVTMVTPPSAPRPMPNPNVMVEYGRASVSPGSACVITVFNEAFGNWTERPFDLRHRRAPLLYQLAQSHTAEEKAAARRRLVPQLTTAIRAILEAPPVTAVLPGIGDFDTLRAFYESTRFRDRTRGRIIGFWCGLIPYGGTLHVPDPWNDAGLFRRRSEYRFRLGHTSLPFPTMDASLENATECLNPIHGGAQWTRQCNYSPDRSAMRYCDDAISVTVLEDGRVSVAVRTNNLEPAPHQRREWVMADVTNALRIADRVRRKAGRPNIPYALLVELRYDQQTGNSVGSVPSGNWRLCILGDESGQQGALVSSDPIAVGPIPVGMSATFPEVLTRVYKSLVTSARRVPENDLVFDLGGVDGQPSGQ